MACDSSVLGPFGPNTHEQELCCVHTRKHTKKHVDLMRSCVRQHVVETTSQKNPTRQSRRSRRRRRPCLLASCDRLSRSFTQASNAQHAESEREHAHTITTFLDEHDAHTSHTRSHSFLFALWHCFVWPHVCYMHDALSYTHSHTHTNSVCDVSHTNTISTQ